MFDTLTKGFRSARQKLSGVTELTEANIDQALRDVRLSLLEADVELSVTKRFTARVKEQAVGQEVQTRIEHKGKKVRIGPAERFIKICQDELEAMMAAEGEPIVFAPRPQLTGIVMLGLQGVGKTTTSAKLARLLEQEHSRKCLLVAADTQRPGAVEQLQVLGQRVDVPVFAIPGGSPPDICEKALEHAKKTKRDTVIYDTAGRLAIDDELMGELAEVQQRVRANNSFLVVDAMTGQDAVRTARSFHERLNLSGVVLTKLDGDARGGAALSVREVTGAPVRFVGMGEALDRLEVFRPEGMASRILGFGDVVGLMKDFEGVVDEKKAEQDAKRMLRGRFTFDDFLQQIETLQQMGPLKDLMEKLPFFSEGMPEGMNVDERELGRVKAIVNSMTLEERREAELFKKQRTRVERVARGCGRTSKDVAELINRFFFMRQMMGNIGQQAGMLAKVPGMKQLAMANRLKDAVDLQGDPSNPMMSGIADSLLEAAVANEISEGGSSARTDPAKKGKRKAQRKQQKKARRRSRK